MRRFALILPLLAACASAPKPTPVGDEALDADWFRLPETLRTHPDALEIAPLEFHPPAPRLETLPNGLKIYLLEERTAPLITLRALVRFGAVDEPRGREGLAELTLAAMCVGGAGERSPEELDDALEFMAASFEAGAGNELAEVSMNVPSKELQPALAIFADVLLRPRFDQAALGRIRARALEGIRRREDSPGGLAARALQKMVFGADHPLAREPTIDSVQEIRREDLQAVHASAFVPGSVLLMASGDFDSEQMLQQLTDAFGNWRPGQGVVRELPAPNPPTERQVVVVSRPVPQARVRIGQLGFMRHDPREYALRVADSVLGSDPGKSRLYTEIRDRRGLAYSVGSMLSPGTVGGQFLVAADTRPEAAHEVIEESLRMIEAFGREQPVTAEELAHAKEVYVNNFAFRFDTADKAIFERALHDFYGYPPDYFDTFRDRISSLTPEQVDAAFTSVIDPTTLQIVVVGDPDQLGDLSEFGKVTIVEDVTTMTGP